VPLLAHLVMGNSIQQEHSKLKKKIGKESYWKYLEYTNLESFSELETFTSMAPVGTAPNVY